jgi:hypothetical protein
MDDNIDSSDFNITEGSTLIVNKKKPHTSTVLLHSLGMLHSLDYPASLRFPEKKDWEILSQS